MTTNPDPHTNPNFHLYEPKPDPADRPPEFAPDGIQAVPYPTPPLRLVRPGREMDTEPETVPDTVSDTGPDMVPDRFPDTLPDRLAEATDRPDDAETVIEGEIVTGGPADAPDVPLTASWVDLSARGQRIPIVPVWMQSKASRRATLHAVFDNARYWTLFHLTRTPKYAVKTAWYAPIGAARAVGRLVHWATAEEGNFALRQHAANTNDAYTWQSLNRTRSREARGRWWALLSATAAAAIGLCVVRALGVVPPLGWYAALAALVLLAARAGRPADKPITDRTSTGPRFTRLTAEMVRNAMISLNFTVMKEPSSVEFVHPGVHRDGPGWLARVNLPYGLEAVRILDKRGALSSALRLPVDQVWPSAGPDHAGQIDLWVGREFLFCHRGQRVGGGYLNDTIIPALCRKAGIPESDSRGALTSHRARTTIATQLLNARQPLTLADLQQWLGHKHPSSTRYYAEILNLTLTAAYRRADYFARNVRTIQVLIDRESILTGAAAGGQPWKYYDLGDGWCSYDFFAKCPHRLACARCPFYLPKQSSTGQLLSTRDGIEQMLEQVDLTDEERQALEGDRDALTALVARLADTPTPAGPTPKQLGTDTAFVPLTALIDSLTAGRPPDPGGGDG